ncbi:MAG: hypothetical protein ACFFCW_39320, partial [Candidatus Hodarchaeota archaeon]
FVEVENSDGLQRLVGKMPKDEEGNTVYDFGIGQSGGAKVEYIEKSVRVFPTNILLKHLYGGLETLEDRLSEHRLIFPTFKTD